MPRTKIHRVGLDRPVPPNAIELHPLLGREGSLFGVVR